MRTAVEIDGGGQVLEVQCLDSLDSRNHLTSQLREILRGCRRIKLGCQRFRVLNIHPSHAATPNAALTRPPIHLAASTDTALPICFFTSFALPTNS